MELTAIRGIASTRARDAADRLRLGLLVALTAPDRPARGLRLPARWRRAGYAALVAATAGAGLASLECLRSVRTVIAAPGSRQVAPTAVEGGGTGLLGHGVHSAASVSWPWDLPGGLVAMTIVICLAVVAPLPLMIRYPLLGWRIAWLGLWLVPLAGIIEWRGGLPWNPIQLVVLAAAFCASGIRYQRAAGLWMWGLTLIPWWLWAGRDGRWLAAVAGTVAFTTAAIATDAVGSRRRAQQALADQAEDAELERARSAVLEERARIAREMHDVVAHHMSLIAVRAETAPYRLADLPEPVRAEFGSLSAAARDALADMRRLLGVLRSSEPATRAPQPGLGDLPALIETARQAGVRVRFSRSHPSGAVPADLVPPGVGVCAYRIVQESLSNAGRHAQGATVTVSVDHADDAIWLRVVNGPVAVLAAGPGIRARPRSGSAGRGQGIAGMRERVALLGGSLAAGPSPDGGFAVTAILPLRPAT